MFPSCLVSLWILDVGRLELRPSTLVSRPSTPLGRFAALPSPSIWHD